MLTHGEAEKCPWGRFLCLPRPYLAVQFMNGDFSQGKNAIREINRQAYIYSLHVRGNKSPALEFQSYTLHLPLVFGAWCAGSADEFDLHFFDFPREFLFVPWSSAVSVHSSEHMLSHKIASQTSGCMWSYTKNYSDTNHTKDFLMTQLSVSAGMSEQILLWHEKGCTQSGSRLQRVWT